MSIDTALVTDPFADESEARGDPVRMVEAYDNLNQGSGTTGIATKFLLGAQSAITRLLQIQNHTAATHSVLAELAKG